MTKKEEELYIKRADKFCAGLEDKWIIESVPFKAEFSRSKDPVPFNKRADGGDPWKEIQTGENWGTEWDSAWFHLSGKVPASWKGSALAAKLDFNGEALLFNEKGEALQGLTNGSVFSQNSARPYRLLSDKCQGGEEINLIIEASASNLFGINKEDDPKRDAPKRHGNYLGKVNHMELFSFNKDYYDLYCDFDVLLKLMKALPEKAVRRARILHTLTAAMNAYHGPQTIAACRIILKKALNEKASDSDLKAVSVGHAHIDTAWLWPMRETIRKCGRTFASQLDLMERYNDYIFGASQPQLYEFTRNYYPSLYKKIKERVKEGRWELQGGMWVEADCNVISGESMIRQFLHGKNYYMDEFGKDVKNLWIPDVFGYSAAMPQIMKKCGVDYFLTQKISWSQFNHFPHHSFMWKGIDGSEVLTHFPPEDTYNSNLDGGALRGAAERFEEKGFLDEFMVLFGVGDGGGGPRAEQIEAGIRQKDLEGTPRVEFGRADDFFTRLEKRKDELASWSGELYLELHRGTLTTQAKVKRYNRLLEQRLRQVEFLYSLIDLSQYPSAELDRHWKDMLTLHFHDIIPGSSINWVYKDTHESYERIFKDLERIENSLMESDNNTLTLVNVLSHIYDEPIELPENWHGFNVTDSSGKSLSVQKAGEKTYLLEPVKPMDILIVKKGDPLVEREKPSTLVLENEMIRYTLNDQGRLISCYDKELEKEILSGEGNVFSLYEDLPCNWDAWDIDIYYMDQKIKEGRVVNYTPLSKGDILQGLQFKYTCGDSVIEQTITLSNRSKMLVFETHVDWKELHKMLRVHFPVDIRTDLASFDIQYGVVKRNTHTNTSWDMAKFEVAGHKYADLSHEQFGAALINDCKYGYRVQGNVLDLNLLRSPNNPDPDADYGEHDFTYAFLPHAGRLEESSVYQKAAMVNLKPLSLKGKPKTKWQVPCSLDSKDISLEVLKKSEKDESLVIRVVELKGKESKGMLTMNQKGCSLVETDMMEWKELGEKWQGEKSYQLTLKPFEIRTYRLCQP
jgi:alpha-mannosidase